VLLDAVVQLAGQPVSLLDHRQRAYLVGEARVALAQFVQVLLVLRQVFGQQINLLGQQAQVIERRVGDAQREVALQPGLADLERAVQAAGEAAAGPHAQCQPHQRGDDRHQRDVKAPFQQREHRLSRDERQSAQRAGLGDENCGECHRRVGDRQLVPQAYSWVTEIALHTGLLVLLRLSPL